MAAYTELTPISVVTGFLGSGKTTLLNHMLRHPSMRDAAVIINEFGAIGLDHQLVEKVDDNTVLLASGCLCCTIRDDLKQTILDLHGRRERGEIPAFSRMVVETTGLADPSPILYTLLADTTLRHHFRLGSIVTTVDGVNGEAQLDRQEEAVKQVVVADCIALTKADLVEPDALAQLRARLEAMNPSAVFFEATQGVVDVDEILRTDHYDPANKGAEVLRWIEAEAAGDGRRRGQHGHDVNRHDASIHSFCLVNDEPLDWTAFGIWLTMLLHAHGENVLRVKGLLNVRGVDTPVLINGVQHIVHPPVHLDRWPDEDRRSRVIFIVRDIPQSRIERSLADFNRIGLDEISGAATA